MQDALEGVARAVENAFLAADPELIDATVWRLDSSQLEPPKSGDATHRQVGAPPLPGWAHEPAPAEPSPSRPLAPSRTEPDPPVRSPIGDGDELNRFKRGTIIHDLMQWLPELPPVVWLLAIKQTCNLPFSP